MPTPVMLAVPTPPRREAVAVGRAAGAAGGNRGGVIHNREPAALTDEVDVAFAPPPVPPVAPLLPARGTPSGEGVGGGIADGIACIGDRGADLAIVGKASVCCEPAAVAAIGVGAN